MFIPVRVALGAGGRPSTEYNRVLELTERQFTAFAAEARDMTVPLKAIGEDLHAQVAAAFATEGASTITGPWAPLSETYGEWKRQRSAAPILVGLRPTHPGTRENPTIPQSYVPSGKMRMELLNPMAMHVTPRFLLYEPLSDIAGFHETGTGRMPARPPVSLGPQFLHSIDRTFLQWIEGLMVRLGLAGEGSRAAA